MACPGDTLWEHKGNMQSHPPIEFCFVLFPQERVIRFLHSKQKCNAFFYFLPECITAIYFTIDSELRWLRLTCLRWMDISFDFWMRPLTNNSCISLNVLLKNICDTYWPLHVEPVLNLNYYSVSDLILTFCSKMVHAFELRRRRAKYWWNNKPSRFEIL